MLFLNFSKNSGLSIIEVLSQIDLNLRCLKMIMTKSKLKQLKVFYQLNLKLLDCKNNFSYCLIMANLFSQISKFRIINIIYCIYLLLQLNILLIIKS